MRYSLYDHVIQGLLALDDATLRRLVGVIEWIAEQPMQAAQAVGYDLDGREVLVRDAFGFRLHYFIAPEERVNFSNILVLPRGDV